MNYGTHIPVYLNKLVSGEYEVRTFPSTEIQNITVNDSFILNQLNVNERSSIAF